MRRLIGLGVAIVLCVGVSGVQGARAASLSLSLVQSGFTEPVFLTNAGDARLFVVELGGVVKILEPDNSVSTFLDLTGLVEHTDGHGLFSLTFHPNYTANGLIYVYYARADDGANVLAEYRVAPGDPDVADPASARVVLVVPQPNPNHNGGWMGFKGRNLYIAIGDGGSTADSLNNGQSKNVLNGKILRINPLDPDGPGARRYSIPRDNPFVGRAGKDAIWSWGLRNPWRCSFDRGTGKLWCGDVGESSYEEIDRVRTSAGHNFGWHLIEGFHYFDYPGKTAGELCAGNCRTLPIAEYAHVTDPSGCTGSITGGYVDRRPGATLRGRYVFGDFCSGAIWTIPATFSRGDPLPDPVAHIGGQYRLDSFGEGADGRLYVVDRQGAIWLINES